MKKVLSFLNLDFQENQAVIAASCFVSLAINSYIGPMLCKTVITALPAQWLSFETVWCCLASLALGVAWKGAFRKNAMKWFVAFAAAESLAGLSLGLWLAFAGWNVWVYAVFSLFYVSVVSFTIGKCIMAFKSKLWNEKSREKFDNTDAIVRNVGLLLGGSAAMAFCPSLKTALVLFAVACVVDDVGWITIYLKCRDRLEEGQ